MALTVSSSLNQKTWDATVRVTGGHPHQLWGIGAVQQSAVGSHLTVDRVLIRDADERMVGYAQLLIRQDSGATHAQAQQAHVNKATMVPAFMQKLADYVRDRYDAESITLSVDTAGAEPLRQALTQRGWTRQGDVPTDSEGPRRLRVPLGAAETSLSSRLSPSTLDRCRAGLKVSDVAVREITANSGGVRAVGLKTGQINHLLKDLGQDSLLLVAAQERPDEQPEALGYLWFVHTVNLAMLYRVGFTRKARDMGIDDALLLTGAVELQKRGVQRMDGGDPSDKDVPTVVRELADRERTVLGTWRKDLVAVQHVEVATAQPEPRKRGLFGRKKRSQEPAVEPQTQPQPEPPKRVDEVRQQVSEDLGIETTGITPAQSHLALGGGQASALDGAVAVQPPGNESSQSAEAEPPAAAAPTAGAEHAQSAAPSDPRAEPPATASAQQASQASVAPQDALGVGADVDANTHVEGDADADPRTDADSAAPTAKPSKRNARKQRRKFKRAAQAPEAQSSVESVGVDTDTSSGQPLGSEADRRPVAELDARSAAVSGDLEPAGPEDSGTTAAHPGDLQQDSGEAAQDSTPPVHDSGHFDQDQRQVLPQNPESDPGREPEQAGEVPDGREVDSTAPDPEPSESRRSRGPLAFGKRIYSESLHAFRDAAGR